MPDDFEPDDFEEDDFEADKPEDSALTRFWHSISDPLWTAPQQTARSIASGMQADSNDSVNFARLKGFGAGALEGIGDLASGFSSPLSLATLLTSGGSSLAGKAGLSGLARLLDIGAKTASVPAVAHGGYQILNPESSGMERAFGVAELAGGASAFAPHGPGIKAPELIDDIPPPRRAPLQLTEGRYIAGPGGVEREGLIRPTDAIELEHGPGIRYHEPEGGTSLDTDAERLKQIFYTGHEQAGGTSLEVPDQPYMPSPPTYDNPTLGYNPASDADLPFPLNITPEALRPRSQAVVDQALIPDRFARPPDEQLDLTGFGDQIVPPPNENSFSLEQPDMLGGTKAIQPGEDILPSAAIKTSAAPHIQETQREPPTTFGNRVTNFTAKNVEPGAPGSTEQIQPIVQQNESTLRRIANGLFVSGEKQLERMGEVGNEIRRLLSGVEYSKRELYNKFADSYITLTKDLTKEEQVNFVAAMEGLERPINPVVANAVAVTHSITDHMAQEAINAGVRMKNPQGKVIPFKPIKEYWPHRPVNPISQSQFIDELMAKNPGMSRSRAMDMAKKFQSESEWFNSPQHARMLGDFDYRKDLGAMTDHMADMADIISRAKILGPGDIGNPKSIISQTLERAPNRTRATELTRTALRGGMDKNNEFYQAVKKVNSIATKMQVFTKLGLFPISNLNNQLQTMLHGNLSDFATSFTQAISGSPTLKAIAKEYGTVGISQFPAEILAEGGRKPIPIVGGLIQGAENFARTVATGTGIGTSKSVFKLAQAGDKLAIKKLQNLLLRDDVSEILKQERLDPEQLKFATQRFVELSQQLNSNMKIPPAWANEPLLSIPLLFKKLSFQGTKSVKDAIMADPKRNIPLFLIASPLLGELTGDLKSVIYGVIRGAPAPDGMLDAIAFELSGRHKFADKLTGLDSENTDEEWLVNRLTADILQSWGLGLVADMMQGALGGKNAGYSAVFGPAIDQAISVISGVGQGDVQGLGREALRSIPIVGPGIQRRILPFESQEMPN